MRCIEISSKRAMKNCDIKINRNMRCIEILIPDVNDGGNYAINRNMRCIEMQQFELAESLCSD